MKTNPYSVQILIMRDQAIPLEVSPASKGMEKISSQINSNI
ncbi:hypothetical protein [uncultured Draconibacterium sp.]|nr:hypothetical protein [uncultured Draconibacterium sp.]